jgi:hypothetical protein
MDEKTFPARTTIRCNRCDEPGPAPREFHTKRHNRRSWRMSGMMTHPVCGHVDAHYVYDSDLPPTPFKVVSWDTGEILSEHTKLSIAKRYARGQGHTGEDHEGLTNFPPVAHVANEAGEVLYNPRFSKRISSAAGGLINSQNSDSF